MTKKVTNKKIKKWCKNTFGKTTNKLILFSEIYLKIEMIEVRWCPYKRSKKFYYRNKDKRYLNPEEETIYKVGKILYNHETITCDNCPKVVNENWKYTKSNRKSIFQPLLDVMIDKLENKEKKSILLKSHTLFLSFFLYIHKIIFQ